MKYKLLNDSKVHPDVKAGATVYSSLKCDYGLARDDAHAFGYPCRSVTLNADGDYPLFVVPASDLEPIA